MCFSDGDPKKHGQKIRPYEPEQREFDILSLSEALQRCPEADVFITLDPLTEAYRSVFRFIRENGVPEERIGPVPDAPVGRPCIFYAAGRRAEINLKQWVFNGIIPVCFADSDAKKHHKTISFPPSGTDKVFDILPLQKALEQYPEARVVITVSPDEYDGAYEELTANGIPAERIGLRPQHCGRIGHYLLLGGMFFSACCHSGYAVFLPTHKNIREDMEEYYAYCETLRRDLNEGRLTSCTGCIELKPGKSEEELKLSTVNLATGLPGGANCNFKCCYCNYGSFSAQKFREREDNVLDILKYFSETGEVNLLHYEAGELTISPYKQEILKLIEDNNWKARILSNGFVYVEEIKNLLAGGRVTLNVSLDSGTPATFQRVKGVDGFDRVVENLEHYAQAGRGLQLKYIVLTGINCGESDVDGFIDIADRVSAKVIISRDNTRSLREMPAEEYAAVVRLARHCIDRGIPFSYDYVSAEYRAKLEEDGIYRAG